MLLISSWASVSFTAEWGYHQLFAGHSPWAGLAHGGGRYPQQALCRKAYYVGMLAVRKGSYAPNTGGRALWQSDAGWPPYLELQ